MSLVPRVQLCENECRVRRQHFAQGSYGVYFSFPQLGNVGVFIATGPTGNAPLGNASSPSFCFIWGNNAGVAVNAATAQHSAVCEGGTVP